MVVAVNKKKQALFLLIFDNFYIVITQSQNKLNDSKFKITSSHLSSMSVHVHVCNGYVASWLVIFFRRKKNWKVIFTKNMRRAKSDAFDTALVMQW